MRKFLPLIFSLLFSNYFVAQKQLKYLDYVFPNDSLAGFNHKKADSIILAHYFFGIEYKVMMYKMKRDFINTKYGYYNPLINSTSQKPSPPTINAAPCVNEDFEAATATTGTTAATAIGNTLAGWTVTQGQNTGINGSCLQTGCCPTVGSTDAWVRTTPYTAPAPLGTIPNSPLGGTKVLQMNDNIWAQGEVVRIQQTFPVTATNALFQFAYMAAMNGSGHACCDQPYMRVEIMDCMNNILACPKVDVIPPGPSCTTVTTTGWLTNTLSITYTPNWIVKSIDLSPYLGTCVTIKITVGDCDGWAHYGYAFVDCVCKPMTVGVNSLTFPAGTPLIAVAACGVATASLQAPAGMGPYLWNGPGGSGVTSNTNQAVNTTVAGNYTLTMTPPGVCAPITKTLSLSFSTYPTGGFTRPNTCTTYTLTNSGAAAPAVQTYSFAGPGAPASFTTTSPTSVVNFAPSTTYTITQTITNAAGCYTTTSQVITTPAGPSPAFSAAPSPTQCLNGNAYTFNASNTAGTHTYNFSPTTGAPATGNTANYGAVNFTSAGTYTVTHTINTAGCITASTSVVQVNPTPTISVASGTAPPCAGSAATLIASGGPGTLTWTGPSSYTAVGGGTTSINNFQTTGQGIYTLTANNGGCITTSTVSLVMPAQPTATITNTGPYCIGQTIQLNATTSSTAVSWSYWYNSAWTWWNFSATTTPTISNAQTTSSGVYYFYVSFTNGCWAQVQTSVTVNPCVLPIELSKYSAHCTGFNSVEIDWETQTEKNCSYFEVMRSEDGLLFTSIGQVKAHGTTFEKHEYKFIDALIEPEKYYYYRLREIDSDNSVIDLGQLVFGICSKTDTDIGVFPIPATNEIDIVSRNNLNNADIEIRDVNGRLIKLIKHVNLPEFNIYKLNISDIPGGTYHLVIYYNDSVLNKKIVISR